MVQLISLILILSNCYQSLTSNPDSAKQVGLLLYQDRRYTEAIEALSSITDSGKPEVFFKLGIYTF